MNIHLQYRISNTPLSVSNLNQITHVALRSSNRYSAGFGRLTVFNDVQTWILLKVLKNMGSLFYPTNAVCRFLPQLRRALG